MEAYAEKYTRSLLDQVEASLSAARGITSVSEADVSCSVDIQIGDRPAVTIIQKALKDQCGLIVKRAENDDGQSGFKAIDMELLRKSACPVWLSRPITRHRQDIKVAVAIEPHSPTAEGRELSLKLLKIARNFAKTCDGNLSIVSIWDYPHEEYLRYNPWVKMNEQDITRTVEQARLENMQSLHAMLGEAGERDNEALFFSRGAAEQMIPRFVQDQNIDILIMGTLGRVGIDGFLMGNTAENIVKKINCSLLALKPNGFVSPVKAYA